MLPKAMLENQELLDAIVADGVPYKLTKHGRHRYCERFGFAADSDILRDCIDNPHAVWKWDGVCYRLVTVLDGRRPA